MNETTQPPSRFARFITALMVACAAGGLTFWLRASGRSPFSDFDVMWLAGRALIDRHDSHAGVASGLHLPLDYPLPAVILTLPFVALPQIMAATAWIALGFGLLAYCLTSRGLWALLCL